MKKIRVRGIVPEGIYTNDKGDRIKVTWEAFDRKAYAEALQKEVKKP